MDIKMNLNRGLLNILHINFKILLVIYFIRTLIINVDHFHLF